MRTKVFSMALTLGALCIITHQSPAFATTYYVAPNGTGTACTIGNPCGLNTGLGKLAAGDTLYLRGGSYKQTVSFSTNGTSTSRITIAGYPGETAIIDGNNTMPSHWGTLFNVTGNYVTIRDLEVMDSYSMGLILRGTYNEAINVYSHGNWENGILITGNYGLVDQCRAYYNCKSNVNCTNRRGNWASGISAARYPTGATIRNSVSWNNWGEGISTFESASTTIEDNVSYDNFSVNMYISDTSNTVARRNMVYTTPGNPVSCAGNQFGIVFSCETGYTNGNNTVVNNFVIGGDPNNLRYWHSNQGSNDALINNVIAYNTFVNSTGTNIQIDSSPYHRNTIFKNNIVEQISGTISKIASGLTCSYNNWSKDPSSGSGTGDVIGNPKLAKTGPTGPGELAGEYFKISSDSPARDKGDAISAVTADFFRDKRPVGTYPDMGGHEYAGTGDGPPDPPTGVRIKTN